MSTDLDLRAHLIATPTEDGLPARLDGPCRQCQAMPCICGEVYFSWPLERVERLRSVLTRVLLKRSKVQPTSERIFPVDEDEKGGL